MKYSNVFQPFPCDASPLLTTELNFSKINLG